MPHSKQLNLMEQMAKIFVPQEYLNDFDINHIEELPEDWVIELEEKDDRIPEVLRGKEMVLDGYCNEIDILTHAFSLKKIYLHLIRRRWKEKGTNKEKKLIDEKPVIYGTKKSDLKRIKTFFDHIKFKKNMPVISRLSQLIKADSPIKS